MYLPTPPKCSTRVPLGSNKLSRYCLPPILLFFKEGGSIGEAFVVTGADIGIGQSLATYPPGEVGTQVTAANECLADVLSDASWIIAPHERGDDDIGNTCDRNGGRSTTDIII